MKEFNMLDFTNNLLAGAAGAQPATSTPLHLDQFFGDQPTIVGPLTAGHYIQVGSGCGFYVPVEAFDAAQSLANESGRVQFLGVTQSGQALSGSRDEILSNPDSAGVVAWITPKR
jgi:hypothetical protein